MTDVFKAAAQAREAGNVQSLENTDVSPLQLSARHKHICALSAAGLSSVEISELVQMHVETVRNILKLPQSKELIERLSTDLAQKITEDVGLRIQAAAGEAFTTSLHIMRHSKNERLKQISAFDVLDRAGFKAREVHVTAKVELPKEEAAEINKTLQEMQQPIPHRPNMDNAISELGKKPVTLGRNLGEV